MVYVSDYNNHHVSVFTADEGQYVTSFGKKGDGLGEFKCLGSVTIENGALYVCDRYNHRVQACYLNIAFMWLCRAFP